MAKYDEANPEMLEITGFSCYRVAIEEEWRMTNKSRESSIATGKQYASRVRAEIDTEALVLLFGSCAKNSANDRSDIDIAVISKEFGDDIPNDFARLYVIAYNVNSEIEPHPFSCKRWKNPTPFIREIMETGVAL